MDHNTTKRGNYESGSDYVLEYGELGYLPAAIIKRLGGDVESELLVLQVVAQRSIGLEARHIATRNERADEAHGEVRMGGILGDGRAIGHNLGA